MDPYYRYPYAAQPPPDDYYPPPQPPPVDEPVVDDIKAWWVDGDGIEHRVIQTDIARYLGNDATVRRGDKNVIASPLSGSMRSG